MSSVYITRQPVFYSDMSVYGYKLLYRENSGEVPDAMDGDRTNAFFIDNILLTEFGGLTDGTHGFIKFTKKLILAEAPLLFPKDTAIIEVPGDIEFGDDTLTALKKIKGKGYKLALDGFDMSNTQKYAALKGIIDIIKIDYGLYTGKKQSEFIKGYGKKTIFLAKCIESREDFAHAKNMGYKLFQGAFYGKPVTVDSKNIGSFSSNLIFILNELSKTEPNFDIITSAFQRDVELSYKVLRLVNSVYYGMKYHTDSLRMALIQLGAKELTRWVNVMLLKGMQRPENAELIKNSIIRGKMLSLLAIVTGRRAEESNYFISGMFSSIDMLLGRNMAEIIENLPLGDEVCRTLLGEKTNIRKALDAVLKYEGGYWNDISGYLEYTDIGQEAFISLYVDAIRWQKTL